MTWCHRRYESSEPPPHRRIALSCTTTTTTWWWWNGPLARLYKSYEELRKLDAIDAIAPSRSLATCQRVWNDDDCKCHENHHQIFHRRVVVVESGSGEDAVRDEEWRKKLQLHRERGIWTLYLRKVSLDIYVYIYSRTSLWHIWRDRKICPLEWGFYYCRVLLTKK